ncbi:MAG: gliding motility protein GldL [Bacteroidales bacterium]|nr:gliding motility protein GldL [Bacteroidales bacterium]
MPKLKKNFNAIQAWLHTQAGQTFLNYAYSWGASIVILGALFKLTHIAGADIMLFIGMGTEVIVFFLSGFDTPLVDYEPTDAEDKADAEPAAEGEELHAHQDGGTVVVGGGGLGGGTIIIGGGSGGGGGYAPAAINMQQVGDEQPAQPVDAAQLADNLSHVTIPEIPGMPPAMREATENYVNQLNELTETLKLVAEQSKRLTRDSEEMENMNRTLTGINRFYEMQLRSVGQQSATIDDVNTQTKRLAEQLAELNGVYARMVEALKMKVG